jgi:hypothetical protein
VLIGTVVLTLAILPRWAGAAWLLRGRTSRYAPETIFGVGVGLAGIATLFVLRSGTNSAWFALASSGIIGVLSAVGLGRALGAVEWLRPSVSGVSRWRDPVVWSMAFAVVINALVLFALALAEVSGAPVLWRGLIVAWVAALVLPLIVIRSRALHGPAFLRWGAIATSTLIFTSMVARVGGPIIWDGIKPYATPVVKRVILLLDPEAEFPTAAASFVIQGGGPLRAGVIVPVEDTRGASDGVARTGSIIQWSPALNDGALWLKASASASDLVAMDLAWHEPFLPIMSGVPAYLGGLPYTSGYTTASGAAQIEPRKALVEGFTSSPTAAAAAQLWSGGVRWLWVQTLHGSELDRLSPYGRIAFSNDEVAVLQLSDPGASSS